MLAHAALEEALLQVGRHGTGAHDHALHRHELVQVCARARQRKRGEKKRHDGQARQKRQAGSGGERRRHAWRGAPGCVKKRAEACPRARVSASDERGQRAGGAFARAEHTPSGFSCRIAFTSRRLKIRTCMRRCACTSATAAAPRSDSSADCTTLSLSPPPRVLVWVRGCLPACPSVSLSACVDLPHSSEEDSNAHLLRVLVRAHVLVLFEHAQIEDWNHLLRLH